MIRKCKVHGKTEYGKSETKPYGFCLECRREAVNRRRKLLKVKAVEYKGGCCSVCGYKQSMWALEFHHIDPTKKDFAISTDGHTRSWESIKIEIDKCILLCSNCHAEEHERLAKNKNPERHERINTFKKSSINAIDDPLELKL
jgi:5-methylcytosine-specific restriction endonuclease McrA